MGCATTHCMISSAQSPSQNWCRAYASDAWWGFWNANDRQKIFACIRRCFRTGFCSPDLADFHDLYISSDEKLFNKNLIYPNHILRTLLPSPSHLLHKITVLEIDLTTDSYLTAFLYCQNVVSQLWLLYWLFYILDLRFVLFLYTTAVWHFAINEYVMLCYVTLW